MGGTVVTITIVDRLLTLILPLRLAASIVSANNHSTPSPPMRFLQSTRASGTAAPLPTFSAAPVDPSSKVTVRRIADRPPTVDQPLETQQFVPCIDVYQPLAVQIFDWRHNGRLNPFRITHSKLKTFESITAEPCTQRHPFSLREPLCERVFQLIRADYLYNRPKIFARRKSSRSPRLTIRS